MKIDLQAHKAETQWIETFDRFWLKAAPEWFSWVTWMFLIGALHYIEQRTHMLEVRILLGLSYLVLFFYLNSFFFSIQIHGVPWIKSNAGRRLLSLLISGSLAYLVSLILTRVVPLTKP